MFISDFDNVVSLCDKMCDTDAYCVTLALRGGHKVRGAWHRRTFNMVQVDIGDDNNWNQPVFVDIADIVAVTYEAT